MQCLEEQRQKSQIQTITNEKGTAIKFADGTMICRQTLEKENFLTDTTYSETVQNIKIYRSAQVNWNFPVKFCDTNVQVSFEPVSGNVGARFYVPHVSWIDKTVAVVQLTSLEGFLENSNGYKNLTSVSAIAIGHWK